MMSETRRHLRSPTMHVHRRTAPGHRGFARVNQWPLIGGVVLYFLLGPGIHTARAQLTVTATPNPAPVSTPVTVIASLSLVNMAPGDSLTCANLVIEFGDGTRKRFGAISGIAGSVITRQTTHVYATPGTFTIQAFTVSCTVCSLNGCQPTNFQDSTRLTVIQTPGRILALTAQPPDPIVGETVRFTVNGTGTCGRLRLDFGDGQTLTLGGPFPLQASHRYRTPGTYRVAARGLQACTGSASTSVNVQPPPPPDLVITPEHPQVGVPIEFRIRVHPVYQCTAVTIDFGDGTRHNLGAVPPSTLTATHAYRTDRTFTVRVTGACFPVNIDLQQPLAVTRTQGPLSIRRIELRFADGRGYITIPQKTRGLRAYADLTFNGSGLLKAAWEVDGRVIGLVREYLTFGGQTTLASPEHPELPTFEPGLHRVTLRIDPSIPAPPPPTIFYMVTVGEFPGLFLITPPDAATVTHIKAPFRWTRMDTAVQYLLEIRPESGSKSLLRILSPEPVWHPTLAQTRPLRPGTKYVWRVTAMGKDGRPLATSASRTFRWLPDAGRGAYVPHQVMVLIKTVSSDREKTVRTLAQSHELRVGRVTDLKSLNAILVRFIIPDNRTVTAVIKRLQRDPRVTMAQPNYLWMTLGLNDPMVDFQYASETMGLNSIRSLTSGKGVTLAVIDTGVDAAHPDLVGQIAETVDVTGHPYTAEFHGTLVAGIISARANNHIGIAGVAPAARIVAIRACWASAPDRIDGMCTTETLARALDVALQRSVRVIHMSLGGPQDAILKQMIDRAIARGIPIVAAAGPGNRPTYPAAWPNVMAITAVDRRNRPMHPTPRGEYIDFAAPGVDIVSTIPGGGYRFVSGTSFAAAYASGLVALMLQLQPHLTPAELTRVLEQSALDLGPPGKDPVFGAGLMHACRSMTLVARAPLDCHQNANP